jgi:hypothetical protein
MKNLRTGNKILKRVLFWKQNLKNPAQRIFFPENKQDKVRTNESCFKRNEFLTLFIKIREVLTRNFIDKSRLNLKTRQDKIAPK